MPIRSLREPPHPPYGGNTTQPRQLQRWLDQNYQGGPLTRTRGLLRIPASTLNGGWNGSYSKRVMQFNYDIQAVFSLFVDDTMKDFLDNTLFCWCVKNVFLAGLPEAPSPYNAVVRYRLNSDMQDTVGAPQYTGQPLNGRCAVEVWTTPSSAGGGPIAQTDFVTSILAQSQDYRYGDDFVLTDSNNITAPTCINFNQTNPNIVDHFYLPLAYTENMTGPIIGED